MKPERNEPCATSFGGNPASEPAKPSKTVGHSIETISTVRKRRPETQLGWLKRVGRYLIEIFRSFSPVADHRFWGTKECENDAQFTFSMSDLDHGAALEDPVALVPSAWDLLELQ